MRVFFYRLLFAGVVLTFGLGNDACAQPTGRLEINASNESEFLSVIPVNKLTGEAILLEFVADTFGEYNYSGDLKLENGVDEVIGEFNIWGHVDGRLTVDFTLVGYEVVPTTGSFFFSMIAEMCVDPAAVSGWNSTRSYLMAGGDSGASGWDTTFNSFSRSFLNNGSDTPQPDSNLGVSIQAPSQFVAASPLSAVPTLAPPTERIVTQVDVNFTVADIQQEALRVVSSIEYAPLLNPFADYNNDGVVDAADYAMFRNLFEIGGAVAALANDPTPGVVNTDDYDRWRNHYGEAVLSVMFAPSATPAPGGGALAALALALMSGAARRYPIRRRTRSGLNAAFLDGLRPPLLVRLSRSRFLSSREPMSTNPAVYGGFRAGHVAALPEHCLCHWH